MELAPILILGGLVLLAWLVLWSRQRRRLNVPMQDDSLFRAIAAHGDAILVAREHGQLVYVNDITRKWLGMNGGEPNLEVVARQVGQPDSFLELFAAEVQTSFQIGSRWVEASSHRIPAGSETRTVVVMRELTGSTAHPDALNLAQAITIIHEIGETVNASQGIEQVLQALLTILGKSIPADAGEITLWDETNRALHPRGWIGDGDYVVQLVTEANGTYKLGEGISGWVARYLKPVLIEDRDDDHAIRPRLQSKYRSFVAVPLEMGDRFIGTLEFASQKTDAFSRSDLALLQAVARQIATSIYNTELYSEQVRRVEDIASLQQVAERFDMEHVEKIYAALSGRIAALLDADMCGILLFDDRKEMLIAEPDFHGLPVQLVQNYRIPLPEGSLQRDVFLEHDYWMSNDLADEPLADTFNLRLLINAAGVRNTLMLPVQIGMRRLGMIQAANKRSPGGFTQRDVRNLQILAAQAAVIIENIRLYQTEQRVNTELGGLQEISQAISGLRQDDEFFAGITERIAELMDVDLCGVLLYDDAAHTLTSQMPFHGTASDVLAHYKIDLKPGTELDNIWQSRETWYTNRATTDPVVHQAGIADLYESLNVRNTLLAVMSVGGRRVGVVQAFNKHNAADFNERDARLLLIFANQAAAIIENVRLYREMQQRADEAEGARRVAELASAISTGEHSFTPVLAAISRLTHSPIVFIALLVDESNLLVIEPRHTYGVDLAEPLLMDISRHRSATITESRQPYLTSQMATDADSLPSQRRIATELGLTGAMGVPLLTGERSLGEFYFANGRTYTEEDLALAQPLALQVASALDRVRLNEAAGLNLNRRLLELAAISRVSSELNETLDLRHVLDVMREEAVRATGSLGCTIVMFKPRSEWRAPDRPSIDYRVGDGDSALRLLPVERDALTQQPEPVIVDDYSESALEALPAGARSAIAASIIFADDVVGIVHLYSDVAHHYDTQSVTFLVTLTAKASLGYANAARYEENVERQTRMRQRVEQLNQIFELGQMLQGNHDPIMMLEAIAYSVQQSVGFDVVLMTLVDEDDNIRRVAQAGLPIESFEQSKGLLLPRARLDSLMQPNFTISESFFLPIDRASEWYVEGLEALTTTFDSKRTLRPQSPSDWRDGDMLLVPMMGANGNLIGMMSLDRPFNNRRPDKNAIEILEIFAHQAATTLENTRLYIASVSSAEQEARLNEVLEAVTRTLNVNDIAETVARGALRMLPFMRMTLALRDLEQPVFELLRVIVHPDESLTVNSERRASLDNTALGLAYESGHDALYYAGENAYTTYHDLKGWQAEGEQTSLIIPLVSGGETLGALHLGSDLQRAYGFEEFRPLVKRVANLAGVAIQNARLFNQAVNLRIFTESVFQSIQQGIIVLDSSGRIVSVNDYMRQRFAWDDKALNRDLFAYRPELISLVEDVRAVMETGEPREQINQVIEIGGIAASQNFYLYPLQTSERTRGVVLLVEDVTERVRLEADVAARTNQLAKLTEVSNRITASLNREDVIALALDEMEGILAYDTMTLWQRQGDMMTLEGSRGLDKVPAFRPRVEISSHERVRKLVETQSTTTVSRLQGWDALPGEENIRSWLGVPLIRGGDVVGMIALGKAEPGFYTTQAEQVAATFANQVAVALINADLYSDAERRTQRLSLLNRVSVALARSLDNEDILEIALREVAQMLRVPQGRAFVIERDFNIARGVVEYPRGEYPPASIDFDASPVLQYISENLRPLIVENVLELESDEPLSQTIKTRKIGAFIALPIAMAGQPIGLLEMEVPDSAHQFEPEQVELAMIVANQAAIALQNANLLEQTLVRTRELETLLEAAQATSFTLDLDEVFQNVARLTLQALDMDDCIISLYFPIENVLEVQIDESRYGTRTDLIPTGTRISLNQYPTRLKALIEKQVVIIRRDDPAIDPLERAELDKYGSSARMILPLISRDQSTGLIQIELQAPFRNFGHRDIRMAQALGAQAATAIENARLSTETAARVAELLVINDISRSISSTMDITKMIRIVRDQVPRLTAADEIYLALYDKNTNEIEFPMAMRGGKDYQIAPRPLGNDEVSYVIRYRRVLALGGAFSLEEMLRNLGIVRHEENVRGYLGVPLISGDEMLGVLAVVNIDQNRTFGLNDQRILTTIGTQLAAAIQNARLFNQISHFADELNQAVIERTRELEEERDRIDSLYRITAQLSQTLDIDRVLKSALDMIVTSVEADEGIILTLDPKTMRLNPRAAYMSTVLSVNGEHATTTAEILGDLLMENVRGVIVADLRTVDWQQTPIDLEDWGSALAVQLETNEDVLGALVMLSREKDRFTDPHLKLVTAAATQIARAINNADLYNLISDQAEQLRSLLRTEQEEAEKSAAILQSITDGVIVADAHGVVLLLNSAAEQILLLDRDKVLSQPISIIASLFGGTPRQWIATIGEWMEHTYNLSPDGMRFERIDMGDRIVNVQLSPVKIGTQLLGTVSVIRDITREVEVDRMKSEFISNVSHELRTPMTSIKGYADLLVMGAAGHLTQQQTYFIDTIKNNADRMTDLVNDLLNISRIDAGREGLRLEPVNVGDLVSSVVSHIGGRVKHEAKNMKVEVNIQRDLPLIEADAGKIAQILTNVVDNAFNYTYAGGTISIDVRQREDGEHVLISVKDSGIGIPEVFQSRIWGRFERYEEHALVMDAAGTGLGLPIAKNLVEMHGGDIWFESEENVGTTFYISLPIHQTSIESTTPFSEDVLQD
jgi:PAS domain S-box-containing protein